MTQERKGRGISLNSYIITWGTCSQIWFALRCSDYSRGAGDIPAITIPYLNSQFGEIIKVSVLKYVILHCFPLFNRAKKVVLIYFVVSFGAMCFKWPQEQTLREREKERERERG